jgi:hypothetical protein
MKTFRLAFNPVKIQDLASRYDYASDDDPLAAGKKILMGKYTRTNLAVIFEWKTKGRGRSRIQRNSNAEVSDALKLAAEAKTDRAALAVLTGLRGVGVPVASAILTAMHPKRFTVIDFRALEALGVKAPAISIEFYLKYLCECRILAKKHTVDVRTLDRALWQWSKEKSKV